ncbi:DegT/DnrJ/EryC1/StrS aminotransferase [Candidatus Scalindua japonica]|uniref:DegT/DnrJ/EryC1/StrS aminotransferase n=1 Tax=Candidatus Scalindua japonica TaxID=1284222 RepID=A0A286U467_9BACT|nr:DegT/DnrJ/EryC1/StrS family aminotransferase [Candidatus Scalindua japonica]GAX62950.1 DegT/DnrJ/EryC1/StrS aminotransferase [Candidatus Scalindua japonica]
MSFFYHIPPSAAPIYEKDIYNCVRGFLGVEDYIYKFRKELEEYFQTRNVYLVSSGKAALTVILQALYRVAGDTHKDEVIIPAYTCYSVPASIIKAGLKVRLCDIDENTLDFNYSLLPDTLSERTLAVIPCSLFGILSDIERLHDIVQGKGILIIDDAAQAMGVSINGMLAGTRGDVGIFSLDRGKNFTTVEGGIIMTNRTDIADEIEKILSKTGRYSKLRQLVILLKATIFSQILRPFLYWIPANFPGLGVGGTFYSTHYVIRNMSNTQAGLAWNWRANLTRFNLARKENTEYYYRELSGFNNINCLKSGPEATYHRFPFYLDGGKKLDMNRLKLLGMSQRYPDSIDNIPELQYKNRNNYPVASSVPKRLFCLPTHIKFKKSFRLKLIQQLKEIGMN